MLVPSPAVLVTTGALGVALTTALEVITAPYSPAVSAYQLNGAVHAVKVLAVIAFVAGVAAVAAGLLRRDERIAAGAAAVIGLSTLLGALPYSIVETFLDPGLEPAAAEARLDETYAEHGWIVAPASVAVPLLLLALVVLGVVVLRRRLLPRWAPVVSLASIPVAVLSVVLGEAGWAVPHPPAWIFLGLVGYGLALLHRQGRVVAEDVLTSPQS